MIGPYFVGLFVGISLGVLSAAWILVYYHYKNLEWQDNYYRSIIHDKNAEIYNLKNQFANLYKAENVGTSTSNYVAPQDRTADNPHPADREGLDAHPPKGFVWPPVIDGLLEPEFEEKETI